MEKTKNKTKRPEEQLDLFYNSLNEKVIKNDMSGDEVVEMIYTAPPPKPYD